MTSPQLLPWRIWHCAKHPDARSRCKFTVAPSRCCTTGHGERVAWRASLCFWRWAADSFRASLLSPTHLLYTPQLGKPRGSPGPLAGDYKPPSPSLHGNPAPRPIPQPRQNQSAVPSLHSSHPRRPGRAEPHCVTGKPCPAPAGYRQCHPPSDQGHRGQRADSPLRGHQPAATPV